MQKTSMDGQVRNQHTMHVSVAKDLLVCFFKNVEKTSN